MSRGLLSRYALAALVVALALGLRLSLSAVLDGNVPFLLFYPAIAVAAWYGGRGPGLFATGLAALASVVLLLPSLGNERLFSANVLALTLFVGVGVVISELTQRLHDARSVAAGRAADAQRLAAQAREAEERLHVTLQSIGDGVIVTDTAGRVVRMNPVAEQLTGWTCAELQGRGLDERITLLREDSGLKVEFPVARVLREGVVVGLANHTVLVAKDGTRRPIDDSAAPVRDAAGTLIGVVMVFRDVTEQRRDALAHARLAALVDSASDAVYMKALDGVIASWNAGAERLFGYAPGEIVGRHVSELAPPERAHEVAGILARLQRGERLSSFETVRRRKDGTLVDVSVTISPVLDPDGHIVAASTVARDITDRKRWEAALQAARDRAEAADRAKDEFLATVSHELRNPLNAVLGWARLLASGSLEAEQTRRAVEIIRRNAEAQVQLVEDLLDVSRFGAGKLNLDVRPVELAPLLLSVIESARLASDARGVRISSDLDPAAPPVAGDRDRLRQVFWNLVSNAIKFTPAGGSIEVSLRAAGLHVVAAVRDTGRGIPPHALPHIFDRFRQADAGTTRSHGGLGLGLAIARHLVEAHGGTIAAESGGEDRGATFTVSLPVLGDGTTLIAPTLGDTAAARAPESASARAADSAAPAVAAEPRLAGWRVLVVDDDADGRSVLVTELTRRGASVEAAASAAEALELFRARRPDVLVSDIAMPGRDGLALLREIRALDAAAGQYLPAIAVTGYARAEDRQRTREAGFERHLAKPVDAEALVRAILDTRDQRRTTAAD